MMMKKNTMLMCLHIVEEDYNAYVPSPKYKEHKVTKQNILQNFDVV